MSGLITFIQEIIGLYIIAVIGFLAKKTGILKEEADNVFTQLVLYIG